jgi:hypothetical protein
MKIKTSELTGAALDWAVAECEYRHIEDIGNHVKAWVLERHRAGQHTDPYSTDWLWGGPIIERELIAIIPAWHNAGYDTPTGHWDWAAYILGPNNLDDNHEQKARTALIAAMRCFVASKLGDEVEVPDELA